MRAAVLRSGRLEVRHDVPEPVPGPGQVLVGVRACGICGSDLHFARHGATMLALGSEMEGRPEGGPREPLDLDRDVYLGHEFSGEVLEAGPGTEAPAPGTIVTSVPVLLTATGMEPIVYSNRVVGGYGERMLLSAPLLLEVPNGLDPRHAALTEPMAVGLHAVNRATVTAGEGGVGARVRSADLSPARRALAATMGADEVVDPRTEPPFTAWARVGASRSLVAFEAIGVPGILDDALRLAPTRTRIVVAGVCMERDVITPYFAIAKELSLHFVLGYDPDEFAESLRSIAEGDLDVAPLITGEVGLDGVAGAFEALADPERHCKILVVP
jgi:threonine dehydrogenase-like Zn-dependent dehydrogenase